MRQACFGRQLTVDVPCYNEWAQEKDTHVVNSVRSKKGAHHGAGPIRRPPYVVGKLELQLLYVPKPAGAGDEDMPKSMGSAVREMGRISEEAEVKRRKEEEEAKVVVVEVVREYEGALSQQGGDCTHWRRRFFRLQGGKLTAYHEHTHQKRAVINLVKATRLVDDKSMLLAAEGQGTGGSGRRKSAFAEEDEGYAYVEEGFRIRFANGETIDFYADSRAEKEAWMWVLSQVVGKLDPGTVKDGKAMAEEEAERKKREKKREPATWTDLVLAREKAASSSSSASSTSATTTSSSPIKEKFLGRQEDFTKPPPSSSSTSSTATAAQQLQRRQSALRAPARQPSKSAPTSPVKAGPPTTTRVPVASAAGSSSSGRARTPPRGERRAGRAREAVKSMIF